MKKILEVHLYGENDVRFNTDFNPETRPEEVNETLTKVTLAMLTTLWGGNETAVLAMIRMLAIADLSVSVNRKQMIRLLDQESEILSQVVKEFNAKMQKEGKLMVFGPGIMPPKIKS